MMNRALLSILFSSSLLVGCGSTDGATQVESEPVSLDTWISEHLPLPPGFAPGMPAGDEMLLFAPGMFSAGAEDYWSYAFVMRIDEGYLDEERLTDIFEQYYDGLISAVAWSNNLDVGTDPATIELFKVEEGRYDAEIDLVDAFVTHEGIRLKARIELEDEGQDSSFLRVQVSPQEADHAIWRSLKFAAETLELPTEE